MVLFKQIMIFGFYVILSFGITSLINFLVRKKKIYNFAISSLLLLACFLVLILGLIFPKRQEQGFIKYSILIFFAFVGSVIPLLVTIFTNRKR